MAVVLNELLFCRDPHHPPQALATVRGVGAGPHLSIQPPSQRDPATQPEALLGLHPAPVSSPGCPHGAPPPPWAPPPLMDLPHPEGRVHPAGPLVQRTQPWSQLKTRQYQAHPRTPCLPLQVTHAWGSSWSMRGPLSSTSSHQTYLVSQGSELFEGTVCCY